MGCSSRNNRRAVGLEELEEVKNPIFLSPPAFKISPLVQGAAPVLKAGLCLGLILSRIQSSQCWRQPRNREDSCQGWASLVPGAGQELERVWA